MKKILVKDAVVPPGMEYQWSAYPGNGAYLLPNRNQVAVVFNGSCMLWNVDPSMVVEDAPIEGRGGGGPSESFVLALIDKTAELLKYQAPRSVRQQVVSMGTPVADDEFRLAFRKITTAIEKLGGSQDAKD